MLEIERKFLVINDAWRTAAHKQVRMAQGYLTRDGKSSVRVRLTANEARLNIKAAVAGVARAEYDYAVPLADAQEILDTLCIGVIDKTRHYVLHAGHEWEVDEFHGVNHGLVVVIIHTKDVIC